MPKPEPKITRYDESKTMFLRPRDGRMWMTRITAWGETSRSWLSGSQWHPSKYSKAEYTSITDSEYADWQWRRGNADHIADLRWRRDNAEHIGRAVARCLDTTVLRQIAEFVEYEGPK
jgi:hypothetical protein